MQGPKIAQLGAILGLSPPPSPVAWIAEADQRRASDLVPIDRPIIALAPTANWWPKVWPPDRFATACRTLTTSLIPNAIAVVLGGPGPSERAMAAPLLVALPQALDLVGTLSLPEVAAVLQRSALFIGNDSGLMHLSAAAGAPTIGLFGPTDAATYGPVGRCATAVVAASMDGITVDQVVQAAKTLLA
jgi:heptosyltransferase-3